jgi:hypothetical protein
VSRRTRHGVRVLAALVLAALPLAAGCSSGQKAQTNKENTVINGVNVDLGDSLQIRNVYIVLGSALPDGKPGLFLSAINQRNVPDKLTVSTKVARSVNLINAPSGSGSPTASPTGSPTASPTGRPTPSALAGPNNQLVLSPHQLVTLEPSGRYFQLSDLTTELREATYANVTLSSSAAGSRTLVVPIERSPIFTQG